VDEGRIGELRATVDAFCSFIEGLPEDALAEGEWGPKEVLAHLVFWHESYVAQTEALLAGEPFMPPEGRFSDLNAQAVAASRGVPVAELLRRFRAANERLCCICGEQDAEAIVLEAKQGSKRWTLAALVPRIEAHIRNHQRKLERKFK
jgi:hypothetical protein